MPSDFVRTQNAPVRHGADRVCASGLPVRLERFGASALAGSALTESPGDWIAEALPVRGIARLRAGLKSQAYSRHRHDTYTIAVTQSGVQEFDYRGSVHRSLPGQVVILHPDEPHDGRPGTAAGFIYLGLHLDPPQVLEAACSEVGTTSLPFVANPIIVDSALATAIVDAFDGPLEPLHANELIQTVGHALLRNGHSRSGSAKRRALSDRVIGRARESRGELHPSCQRR